MKEIFDLTAFTCPHYLGRGDKREICSWSRIDYILVQRSWANRLLSASTLFDAPCSDHRPVVATFALPTSNAADAEPPPALPTTSEFISRLNPTVFNDQDFVDLIPGVVNEVYRRLEGTAPLGDVYDAALRAVAAAGHARYRSTRADMRRLRAENQSVMEALEARGEHMNEAERDAYALAKSQLDQLAVKEAQWLRIHAHVPSVDSREGQSASICTRLNRRSRQTSIVSLEDVDGTETVDMQEALGIASRHAQSLFMPDPARGNPTNARRSLLDPICAAKCYDDDRSDPTKVLFLFNWAHKLRSFGLARIATKRAKRGNKATTTSSWVKIKPLRAKSAAQIKARRAPNADSNGR
ncbi:BQ5605_C026g10268 [Microbotryum silenes-dioicae]|uniref:BQ5605_C026g10268 protein n=1 Tax=Microbotryum silenes-dioicae TaxID=796604 RepID=A0A2X0PGG7_9BASI|nr:BQ5605_C026g10268 [Microbotryum silenes-dioicae]